MKSKKDVLPLRILPKFYDQIAKGKKKFEYRSTFSKYSGLKSGRYKFLALICRGRPKLKITIVEVTIVKTPKSWLSDPEWKFTPNLYKIRLGKKSLTI